MAIAQPPLIQILSNTKAPYNISTPSANLALSALSSEGLKAMHEKASTLISSRGDLLKSLEGLDSLGIGKSIGGNDANFILVPILNRETRKPDNVRSERIYKQLAEKEGVVVRFRGKEHGCDGCIRITVGTAKENAALLDRLKDVLEKI
jgi:histidinol-phosphate aminotransferase